MNELILLGQRGERLAAKYYEDRGFVIVERNWLCRGGELDLVAEQAGLLVFIEVRTVRSAYLSGAEGSLTDAKLRRVAFAAEKWLSQRPKVSRDIRFDVVAISIDSTDQATIDVFEDAFESPWAY